MVRIVKIKTNRMSSAEACVRKARYVNICSAVLVSQGQKSLPFATARMNPEGVRQTETNTVRHHVYVEAKHAKLTETESGVVVARGRRRGNKETLVRGNRLPAL